MLREEELKNKVLEFEYSIKLRNYEIDNFWKRSWFFGALLISIFTGYFTIIKKTYPEYSVYVSFSLILISLIQCLINRGSKYWQERWENKTVNRESLLGIDVTRTERYNKREKEIIDACIFSKGENIFTRAHRFSVSKLTILLWDLIVIVTFLLWLGDITKILTSINWWCHPIEIIKIFLFHLLLIGYIIRFWVSGKVFEGYSDFSKDIGRYEQEQEKKE